MAVIAHAVNSWNSLHIELVTTGPLGQQLPTIRACSATPLVCSGRQQPTQQYALYPPARRGPALYAQSQGDAKTEQLQTARNRSPAPSRCSRAWGLPEGTINTKRWFLPAIGARYDFKGHGQVYFNVQKNLRQYQAYLAGGGGPWFTGSKTAFDAFRDQGKPESSWTYEAGLRTNRNFDNGFALSGQINYCHVDFSNRLLAISTNPGASPAARSPAAPRS